MRRVAAEPFRIWAKLVVGCSLVVLLAATAWAQEEKDPAAVNLYADAANAQNNKAFDLAAEEWKRFLQKYPKSPLAHKAQHYLGVCQLQLKPPQYAEAAKAFGVIVAKIPMNKDFALNEDAFLNLGWCQFSLGKMAAQPAEANAWYVKSAQTFSDLVKQYPQSKYADQSLYFHGEALYALGKSAEAVVPYAALVKNHPKSSLRADGLYAFGVTQEELKQFPAAGGAFDLFITEFPQHALIHEVRMRKAETILQEGLALEAGGKAAEAQPLFVKAAGMFAAAAAVQGFALADHSLYRQALCLLKQDKPLDAAAIYARVANEFKDSSYAKDGMMDAGRMYYRGKNYAAAATWLTKVIDGEKTMPPEGKTALAPEAAHWLCRIHLSQNEPAKAAAVAAAVLPKAGESAFLVPLLMDQADAADTTPDKRADALAMYVKIATDHPQHASAPQALYNAAFAALQLQKYDDGLKHAAAFIKAYPQNELLPDVKYVTAECNLLLKKYAPATATLAELISAHSAHPEIEVWQVRHGLCLYLQKKYAETIAALSPVVANLKLPAGKAEAYFLIGASQFQLKKFAEAVKSLEASRTTDAKWSKADETLLILSQAQHGQQQTAAAIETVKKLLAEYPQTKLKTDAHYRWGDYAYAVEDFPAAAEHFNQVLAGGADSPFVPFALYNKGWAQLKQSAWPDAIATFTQLIEKHPAHSLTREGQFARGMCRRQAKDYKGAIADINVYLQAELEPDQKASALFERGKSEAAAEDNAAAAATLALLLKENPKWEKADEAIYEMAWAHKLNSKTKESLAAFTKLAGEFPDSRFTAEAHFHVADSHYERDEFVAAEQAYTLSKQKAGEQQAELLEKATYKLGWSLYQQGKFEPALAQFSEQTQKFATGLLAAEGLFMKAEALFKLQKHSDALPAYKAANAAAAKAANIDNTIKALILLHGGQSAGQLKQWQESLTLLSPILTNHKDSAYVAEAHFEIGQAQKNLNKAAEALAAFEKAATLSRGEVGARARFEMGEMQFAAKRHEDAIKDFQRVMFGFGGETAVDAVKNWQAKSAVEAGRCAEVQIEPAKGDARARKIADAKRFYSYVLEKHPKHQLATFAKTRLAALAKVQ